MLWTLVRRECLDHLMSLRFALAMVLIVALFAANGLIYSGAEPGGAVTRYNEGMSQASESLDNRAAAGSQELAVRGPGNLYRRPGPLAFCVAGRDQSTPWRIDGGSYSSYGWSNDTFSHSWSMPWNLDYAADTPAPPNPMLPIVGELDWATIVGMLASLLAVLLTYDAISGERQRGTLRLLMTNPIPRDTVLLGKLIAALLTCGLPLLVGLLTSLLIIYTSGSVRLEGAEWARLLLVVALSLVYVGGFCCLGLLVSSRARRPAAGLLTLLLIWVLSVELIPGALGILGMHLVEPPSAVEQQRRSKQATEAFTDKLQNELMKRLSPSQTPKDREVLKAWAAALAEYQKAEAQVRDTAIDDQLQRVRFGRQLTRLSPTAILRYALEAVTGTGFPQYEHFVAEARQYRARFTEFVVQADQADPDSPHACPVKEGLSARPVDARTMPRFVDRFDVGTGLASAAWDLALLGIIAVAVFLAAYLSWLRCDLAGE